MYNNYGYSVLTRRKSKISCYCHHSIPALTRGCFMHDHVVGLAETPPGSEHGWEGRQGEMQRERLHSRHFFLSVRKLSAKEKEGMCAVFRTDRYIFSVPLFWADWWTRSNSYLVLSAVPKRVNLSPSPFPGFLLCIFDIVSYGRGLPLGLPWNH